MLMFYHIAFYPLILWFLLNNFTKVKANDNTDSAIYPTITVICPAYNEECSIGDKIKSFVELDYPKDKIKMIVISDDSQDNTNSIVQEFSDRNVELIIQSPRGGKQRAHNLVEPSISSDYVLSTDANSLFKPDAVKELVKVIQSSPQIGIVSGELRLISKNNLDSGEGLYWKYECFLKSMDSDFASIIGSNGSIYLIKRDMFGQIHPQTIDDFERTLHVLSNGYKAVYAPQAVVFEYCSERAVEEINRKIRIITREWFALSRYKQLLNPFRYGKISLILISHKLLRWMIFLFMGILLVTSWFINSVISLTFFYMQIIFYLTGIIVILTQNQKLHIPGLSLIAYVTAMGWASAVAFFKFIFKKDMGIWNPTRK